MRHGCLEVPWWRKIHFIITETYFFKKRSARKKALDAIHEELNGWDTSLERVEKCVKILKKL